MKGGVYGKIDLESIDVGPETNEEGKGKASEADFQLEVDDSTVKNAQTKTSTAPPPSSYHQSSENTIEVDDSVVNNAQTGVKINNAQTIDEYIETMPQNQQENS